MFHIKNIVSIGVLLLAVPAFATFYCPSSITCSGTSLNSCKVDNNQMGWKIYDYTNVPPYDIHPGKFPFVFAAGATSADPSQRSGCTYGDLSLNIYITLPGKSLYPEYQSSKAWVNMYRSSYACKSSDPKECPLSFGK
ncbi:MAG: hypothetical protein HWD59_07105 [Coxiellaceae bacterium]|nr:MAG: hypothetical protein HWD59_07105 [Coxiellaceae bacterium]